MHKICDAIHGFIRFDETERQVIGAPPFQRLRYIHQMGVAYLVYPGATHTRFEHSLGVMEIVTRSYDTLVAGFQGAVDFAYWRRILRLAALCHDMGHLPFSHTAEKELLPEGGHERMTLAIIQSAPMRAIWGEVGPHAEEDIIKLSVSEGELAAFGLGLTLSPWERVLSQAITEDNFGADRIDYLIRDAWHTGVGYGHFDYRQLLDCVRIVEHEAGELSIGILSSGIQSVESLWMARYLMYARVYHHPRARIYTGHMRRFMERHYRKSGFPKTLEGFLWETDYQVLTALAQAAKEGDTDAQILLKLRPAFEEIDVEEKVLAQLKETLQEDLFIDRIEPRRGSRAFPVVGERGELIPSTEFSHFLCEIPITSKPLRVYRKVQNESCLEGRCPPL